MTPEEITALVQEQLTAFRTEITTANQGLAASLTREIKKLQQPAAPEKQDEGTEKETLSLKALKQQLQELTGKLEAKDAEAFNARKRSALAEVVASYKSLSPSALQKLMLAEYDSKLKEEAGVWYVEDGASIKPLKDVVGDFLKSEDGKLFLAPSGVNGSGSEETKPSAPTPNKKEKSAEDLLFEAFSQKDL